MNHLVWKEYRIYVALFEYIPGARQSRLFSHNDEIGRENNEVIKLASNLTGVDFFQKNDRAETVNKIIEILFMFYAILQPVLFMAAFAGLGWTLVRIRLYRKFSFELSYSFGMALAALMLSLAYAFAISWFVEFLWKLNPINGMLDLKFYGVGMVSFLTIFEVFGSYLLYLNFSRKART